MNWMRVAIRGAGAVQAAILVVQFVLAKRVNAREQLQHLPRILRQIFYTHWFYIGFVLAFFSLVCFLFPSDLLAAAGLGHFIAIVLAIFWGLKLPLQLFMDREFRRQNRLADALMAVAVASLTITFVCAAMGVER